MMLILVVSVNLLTLGGAWPSAKDADEALTDFERCIETDLNEIEDLKTRVIDLVNHRDKSDPVSSFGLREEDWQRLNLLDNLIPEGSPLKSKLVHAFRILIAAIYQAHGKPVTITGKDKSISKSEEDEEVPDMTASPEDFISQEEAQKDTVELINSDELNDKMPLKSNVVTVKNTIDSYEDDKGSYGPTVSSKIDSFEDDNASKGPNVSSMIDSYKDDNARKDPTVSSKIDSYEDDNASKGPTVSSKIDSYEDDKASKGPTVSSIIDRYEDDKYSKRLTVPSKIDIYENDNASKGPTVSSKIDSYEDDNVSKGPTGSSKIELAGTLRTPPIPQDHKDKPREEIKQNTQVNSGEEKIISKFSSTEEFKYETISATTKKDWVSTTNKSPTSNASSLVKSTSLGNVGRIITVDSLEKDDDNYQGPEIVSNDLDFTTNEVQKWVIGFKNVTLKSQNMTDSLGTSSTEKAQVEDKHDAAVSSKSPTRNEESSTKGVSLNSGSQTTPPSKSSSSEEISSSKEEPTSSENELESAFNEGADLNTPARGDNNEDIYTEDGTTLPTKLTVKHIEKKDSQPRNETVTTIRYFDERSDKIPGSVTNLPILTLSQTAQEVHINGFPGNTTGYIGANNNVSNHDKNITRETSSHVLEAQDTVIAFNYDNEINSSFIPTVTKNNVVGIDVPIQNEINSSEDNRSPEFSTKRLLNAGLFPGVVTEASYSSLIPGSRGNKYSSTTLSFQSTTFQPSVGSHFDTGKTTFGIPTMKDENLNNTMGINFDVSTESVDSSKERFTSQTPSILNVEPVKVGGQTLLPQSSTVKFSSTSSSTPSSTPSSPKFTKESFKTFTIVFPKKVAFTPPHPSVNILSIYPYDNTHTIFSPVNPRTRSRCTNNEGCVRVETREETSTQERHFSNDQAEDNAASIPKDKTFNYLLWNSRVRKLLKRRKALRKKLSI